jgi:hypothetical protein
MNFVVGVPQPHSEAELAAHALVLEEFNKELVAYNEAIAAIAEQGRPKSHVRGQKRSHHGQNGQNGNPNLNHIHLDSTSNPATTYQQHRERALSYDSQFLNQPQVLQTTPNAVLETTNSAPEANTLALEPNTLALQAVTLLGDDFLTHLNTSNNSDQLSMIRSLGREQVHPRTTPERRDEIAVFLNQIQVAEAVETPIEGPAPKRAKDGTLIFEVLTMFASKDKQLPMTKGSLESHNARGRRLCGHPRRRPSAHLAMEVVVQFKWPSGGGLG